MTSPSNPPVALTGAAQLRALCVTAAASIRETMERINENAVGIALVVDDAQRLIGTVTDGDIRRALLGGARLESAVTPFVQKKFTTVPPEADRAAVLDLMKALSLSQIPVVDAHGRLAGLHVLRGMLGAQTRPNWAVILAGGLGSRLRPLTAQVPKPMLRVAGRPILERLILHVVGSGIRRIFLSVNHLAHVIEQHFGDGSNFGCTIDYLRESEPLGTGGPLSLLPAVPEAPLIVLNGDLVTDVRIGELLQFHAAGNHAVTLSVRPYVHQVPFGCVTIDGGAVTRLEEKPMLMQAINAGIYAISPAVLARLPRGAFPLTRLIEDCLARGERVGAFPLDGEWIDVGMTEQLRRAREGTA